IRIASMMLAHYKSSGDEDDILFWSYILWSLNSLASSGMSDEETVHEKEGSNSFRVVMDPGSRHPAFRILFRFLDDVPSLYPDLFTRCGKKPLKRI
ncbi:MAG: hypothetical protein NXY57DRAFT_865825, partial [Lentinula lateritia]